MSSTSSKRKRDDDDEEVLGGNDSSNWNSAESREGSEGEIDGDEVLLDFADEIMFLIFSFSHGNENEMCRSAGWSPVAKLFKMLRSYPKIATNVASVTLNKTRSWPRMFLFIFQTIGPL